MKLQWLLEVQRLVDALGDFEGSQLTVTIMGIVFKMNVNSVDYSPEFTGNSLLTVTFGRCALMQGPGKWKILSQDNMCVSLPISSIFPMHNYGFRIKSPSLPLAEITFLPPGHNDIVHL